MLDKDVIVEKFIKHALIKEKSEHSGDYKKGNKSHKIHLSIRDQLKQEPELAKVVFDELFQNENSYVLYACSVYAIVLNYRREDALRILKNIANTEKNIIGFNAETTLELYKSGELFELHGVSK